MHDDGEFFSSQAPRPRKASGLCLVLSAGHLNAADRAPHQSVRITEKHNKMEKNHKNAEVRYTAGTRHDRRLWQNGTEHENTIGVQEEIDRVRDAHRRTALALVCKLLRDDLSLTRGLLLLRLRTETPNSEWFEYETNVHGATGVIVDHALRITAEHGFAPSTLLDLAISFADFSPLRTK